MSFMQREIILKSDTGNFQDSVPVKLLKENNTLKITFEKESPVLADGNLTLCIFLQNKAFIERPLAPNSSELTISPFSWPFDAILGIAVIRHDASGQRFQLRGSLGREINWPDFIFFYQAKRPKQKKTFPQKISQTSEAAQADQKPDQTQSDVAHSQKPASSSSASSEGTFTKSASTRPDGTSSQRPQGSGSPALPRSANSSVAASPQDRTSSQRSQGGGSSAISNTDAKQENTRGVMLSAPTSNTGNPLNTVSAIPNQARTQTGSHSSSHQQLAASSPTPGEPQHAQPDTMGSISIEPPATRHLDVSAQRNNREQAANRPALEFHASNRDNSQKAPAPPSRSLSDSQSSQQKRLEQTSIEPHSSQKANSQRNASAFPPQQASSLSIEREKEGSHQGAAQPNHHFNPSTGSVVPAPTGPSTTSTSRFTSAKTNKAQYRNQKSLGSAATMHAASREKVPSHSGTLPIDTQQNQTACLMQERQIIISEPFGHIFPNAHWYKVTYPLSRGKWHYLLGEIYQNNKMVLKAVAVPGKYSMTSPSWLKGFDTFLISKENQAGYWLLFEDAQTGHIVYNYKTYLTSE